MAVEVGEALQVGDTIPFQFSVFDAAGAPATPSDIDVTVTAPDGTQTAVSNPSPSGTGVYPVPGIVATQAGTWWAQAVTTGPVSVSPAQSFYVDAAADTVTIVSLAAARAHLRLPSTTTDEHLRRMLVTATQVAESWTARRWRRTTITGEKHDGGRCEIVLRESPVASITTVTENGTALTTGDWFLRGDSAVLVRGVTTGVIRWVSGTQNIVVTYVAAPAGNTIPADVRHGVLEITRALWESQRGGADLPPGDEFAVPDTTLIPPEIRMLLGRYRVPGIG